MKRLCYDSLRKTVDLLFCVSPIHITKADSSVLNCELCVEFSPKIFCYFLSVYRLPKIVVIIGYAYYFLHISLAFFMM